MRPCRAEPSCRRRAAGAHRDRLISDRPAPPRPSRRCRSSSPAASATEERELPLGAVNRTLEDMVRELLRPMLKEWLDDNLPPLVERLVRDEIAPPRARGAGR